MGKTFERNGIDTLRIARKYLTHLESRSLPYLCKYFGICHNPHRALSDVEATYGLYCRLIQDYYKEALDEDEKKIFMPYKLNYQVKRESPATAHQIERLKKLLDYHKIETDWNINKMSRNEISRYTDKLISQYGRIPKAGV